MRLESYTLDMPYKDPKRRKTPYQLLFSALCMARRRARGKGVPATIMTADLPPFPVFCPILDIPLGQGKDCPLDNRASIDRIRPELGYVPGNVRVISFRANMLKSNATADELRRVLRDLEAPPAV